MQRLKVIYFGEQDENGLDVNTFFVGCPLGECSKKYFCNNSMMNLMAHQRGFELIGGEYNPFFYMLQINDENEEKFRNYVSAFNVGEAAECPTGFHQIKPLSSLIKSNHLESRTISGKQYGFFEQDFEII